MAPPQLPGDAPIPDVLHPGLVLFGPPFGREVHAARAGGLEGRFRQRTHPHEPLERQAWLNHRMAAVAVAAPNAYAPRHRRGAPRLPGPRAPTFRAAKRSWPRNASGAFSFMWASGGHHVQKRDTRSPGHLEVVDVVGWRELDHTRAELAIHEVVRHDRDGAVRERQHDVCAHQSRVAVVLRVHGHARIPEHGFRPGGGHREVPASVRQLSNGFGTRGRCVGRRTPGRLRERIPEMVQPTLRLLPFGLLVGERRETPRTPVDDVFAPVDQVFLVQPHEHLPHRAGEPFIQGEAGPRPIAAASDGPELLQDPVTGVVNELPHAFHERLAAQVVSGLAFGLELALDHVLGGDTGVVRARDPEGWTALHTLPADEDVLDRVVEPVSHVEHRRHVGRWDHDHVRRFAVSGTLRGVLGRDTEIPALFPASVDLGSDRSRIEPFG